MSSPPDGRRSHDGEKGQGEHGEGDVPVPSREELMDRLNTLLEEIVAPYRRLVVPQPVQELTTGRVLTMDFIEGRKVTEITDVGRTDIDTVDSSILLPGTF